MQNSSVKDAGVVGIADVSAGQLIRAFIVPKCKESFCKESIHNYLKQHLSEYKQLSGGIRVVDRLPRNQLGKLSRKELNEMAKNDNF